MGGRTVVGGGSLGGFTVVCFCKPGVCPADSFASAGKGGVVVPEEGSGRCAGGGGIGGVVVPEDGKGRGGGGVGMSLIGGNSGQHRQIQTQV
jgi:hypothetical protein